MVTMADGSLSLLLFNLRKLLSHRVTVLSITAALAFYVVWQAGSLVWKLWLLDQGSPQAAALVAFSPEDKKPESLQNIMRYPLIRSVSSASTPESGGGDHPRTSLDLKLVGLMYSTDPEQARAIIDSEADGARSLAVHDRVTDKVEIYRIEPDRVILLHAGRREALLLDPDENEAAAGPGSEGQPGGDWSGNQTSVGTAAKGAKKIDAVMSDFSATPVMAEGQLVGFRLQAVKNPQIMTEWGIGPEDVITAVNGVPLNSQGKLMVLYDKLKKQREFELTIDRDGKTRTIAVDFYD